MHVHIYWRNKKKTEDRTSNKPVLPNIAFNFSHGVSPGNILSSITLQKDFANSRDVDVLGPAAASSVNTDFKTWILTVSPCSSLSNLSCISNFTFNAAKIKLPSNIIYKKNHIKVRWHDECKGNKTPSLMLVIR